MHNVLNAKTFKTKITDIINNNDCKLKTRLGDVRFKMFSDDFNNELLKPLKVDESVKDEIIKQEIEVVLKEINNDKYSKYKRLYQIELDITYSSNQRAVLLRTQFEIARIEPDDKIEKDPNIKFEPFEECSLLSKYSQEVNKGLAVEIGKMVHNGEV